MEKDFESMKLNVKHFWAFKPIFIDFYRKNFVSNPFFDVVFSYMNKLIQVEFNTSSLSCTNVFMYNRVQPIQTQENKRW